jgi:hypothetical protein
VEPAGAVVAVLCVDAAVQLAGAAVAVLCGDACSLRYARAPHVADGLLAEASGHVITAIAPCLRAPQAYGARQYVVSAAEVARPYAATRHRRARRHRGLKQRAGLRLARMTDRRGRGRGRCLRAHTLYNVYRARCEAYMANKNKRRNGLLQALFVLEY